MKFVHLFKTISKTLKEMFMTWIQDPDNIEMDPKHRLVDLKYLDKGSLSSLREGVDLSSGESSPELRYNYTL